MARSLGAGFSIAFAVGALITTNNSLCYAGFDTVSLACALSQTDSIERPETAIGANRRPIVRRDRATH